MKKNSKIITFATLSLMAAIIIPILALTSNVGSANMVKGNEEFYVIHCDENHNKPELSPGLPELKSGDATLTTALGNEIAYRYENYLYSVGVYASLAIDGGAFFNIDPINGIKMVQIDTQFNSGKIDIEWSHSNTFDGSNVATFDDKNTINFNCNDELPSYIKISVNSESTSAIDIFSITITYTCEDSFYAMNAISGDATKGTISGTPSGNYEAGTSITLNASPKSGYSLVGWYENETKVSVDLTYTFLMPANDLSIVAVFIQSDISVGSTIEFGSYPQTKITSTPLITSLTTALGPLPTTNSEGWTHHNYYSGASVANYAYFKDFDYSEVKFRAVYFTSYRPQNSGNGSATSSGSYQSTNGYTVNKLHFFRFETIYWKVMNVDNEARKVTLFATKALDSGNFREFTGQIGMIYANNYGSSNVRNYLNDVFINEAFSSYEKLTIRNSDVDNSAASTGAASNPYACNNTYDKLFLPSYAELDAIGSSSARMKGISDYALSQGCYNQSSYYNAYYWTRSPLHNSKEKCHVVNNSGVLQSEYVDRSWYGVVPMMNISI